MSTIHFSKNYQPTHDRSAPRKTSIYRMTRKLLIEQATILGGEDGYAGWLRQCLERDPIAVLRILMTTRNKVTAINAINNRYDDGWRLSLIEKMHGKDDEFRVTNIAAND